MSDSTYNSSRTNDSTSKKTSKSKSNSNKTDKNISTSNKTDKNNNTSEITLSDQLFISTHIDSLKNIYIRFDKIDFNKLNKILATRRILNDKIAKDSNNQKEERRFAKNLKN